MGIKYLKMDGMKLNVAVIGSRSFDDYGLLSRFIITRILPKRIRCIISGGAKGADSLAERFAEEYHCDFKVFHAEWRIYGSKAGYLRNHDIIKTCDMCFAFWDGTSRGTAHAIQLNKPYLIYYFKKPLQGKLLERGKSLKKSLNLLGSRIKEIYKPDRDRIYPHEYRHLEERISHIL